MFFMCERVDEIKIFRTRSLNTYYEHLLTIFIIKMYYEHMPITYIMDTY